MAKTVESGSFGWSGNHAKLEGFFISEKQRGVRLKFSKDHKDWTIEHWSKVIFSDKSIFLSPCCQMARWRPEEAYKS